MLVPAGLPINFSAVFVSATPANVAFSVYEMDEDSSALLLSPVQMINVVGDVYAGSFTPEAGKMYVVLMAVYTNASFASFNNSFTQQSFAATAMYLTPPVQRVVGVVNCDGGE